MNWEYIKKFKEKILKLIEENWEKDYRLTVLWLSTISFAIISTIIGIFCGAWIPPLIIAGSLMVYIHRNQLQEMLKAIKIKFANIEFFIDLHNKRLEDIKNTAENLCTSTKYDTKSLRELDDIVANVKKAQKDMTKIKENLKMIKSERNTPEEYKDPIEVGCNINGKYIMLRNGLMITSVTTKLENQSVEHGQRMTFSFPAAYASAPMFVQFIGIEQPKILSLSPTGMSIELRDFSVLRYGTDKKNVESFSFNVLGLWKKMDA